MDTLPLPAERRGETGSAAPDTEATFNSSTEVVPGGSDLALALQPSAAVQHKQIRPLRTLDAGDRSGRTAFHLACGAGHRECVRALVLAGCRTELVDRNGMTGWDFAATPPGQPLVLQELASLAAQPRSETTLSSSMATPALVIESRVKEIDFRKKRGNGRSSNMLKSLRRNANIHQKHGGSGRVKGSQKRASTAVI